LVCAKFQNPDSAMLVSVFFVFVFVIEVDVDLEGFVVAP
jgi:hypothetical protein